MCTPPDAHEVWRARVGRDGTMRNLRTHACSPFVPSGADVSVSVERALPAKAARPMVAETTPDGDPNDGLK